MADNFWYDLYHDLNMPYVFNWEDPTNAIVDVAQDAQKALDVSEQADETATEALAVAEGARQEWQMTREIWDGFRERQAAMEQQMSELSAKIQEIPDPETVPEILPDDDIPTETVDVALVEEAPPTPEETAPKSRDKRPTPRRIFG